MERHNKKPQDTDSGSLKNPGSTGTLYIVATPLGNLEDMTFRAVNTLKQVDIIAAEDTRHSKKLLSHYGIQTRLVSCHEHNETAKTPHLISHLKNGLNIALISDAGTPCISDPGYTLVKAVTKEGLPVIPIPGCSAAIAGLSVAGLPTDSFLFLGFLPKKQGQLQKALEKQKDQCPTLILYESPKRIKKLIQRMIPILGNRNACLTREVTKLHEEYIRGPLSLILETLETKERIRGEIALFVAGSSGPKALDVHQIEAIIQERIIGTRLGTSDLAKQISKEFHLSKKQVYDIILNLRDPAS
jgi:16S rRNA (cytidine1402-2'-O)-methyltransferase